MQEQDQKIMECIVKSNNGYGRISVGKLGTRFDVDDVVIVLTKAEYQKLLMKQIEDTTIGTVEDEKDTNISDELSKLLEVSLKPINESHKTQIEDKDKQITKLTNQINAMQIAFNQFNTRINSLGALDILLRKKHIQVIEDFNNSIWITNEDEKIVNADIKQLTDEDSQE